MHDPRMDRLASVLIHHSCELKRGQKILIEATDVPPQMVNALLREIAAMGAVPLVTIRQSEVLRELYHSAGVEALTLAGELEAHQMEKMDAYIGLRGSHNSSELADVSPQGMLEYQKHWWHRVHSEIRVKKTRWVVLRWPTPSMAQQACMSTRAFEDFFFDVCTMDYSRMERQCRPLVERLRRTDRVRIASPGTDLSFSIKGISIVASFGKRNIPDGECFTAPVRDSANGIIQFNAPTIYQGVTHERVRLRLEQGRIVEASSSNSERLNAVLDSDEGARYIGEWSLGFNPYILNPMKDILFDEKIAGSFHFTPGSSYEIADNGNRSEVHWDMVLVQRPEWGGGEIWLDDELVRKDGLFVSDELAGLNPDNLR